jgi:hypothetical protein
VGIVAIFVAGCGRVGFGELGDATGEGDAGFFGAARCPTGVVLCEDFEAPQIDTARWNTFLTQGTATIDTTHVARGTRALRLSGASATSVDLSLDHVENAALPDPVYVRAFVYAPALPAMATEVMLSMNVAGGSSGVLVEANYQGRLELDGWGVSGATAVSAAAAPTIRWACVEWMVTQNPGAMTLWVDDVELPDLQAVPWSLPPSFEIVSLRLGYDVTVPAALDLWIDEVIVDGARIGCEK